MLPRSRKYVYIAIILAGLLSLILFIVVTTKPQSEKEYAKQIASACNHKDNRDTCYADKFSHLEKTQSTAYTLGVLSALQEEAATPVGCHFIAHVIAEEAVVKEPDNWQDVIRDLPVNDCTGGFIMGVLEGEKQYHKQFSLNKQTIPQLCTSIGKTTNDQENIQTCIHTTGHLLLIESSGDVKIALQSCSDLEAKYQYECWAGVFMENIFRRNLLAHGIGKPLDWNNETLNMQQTFCQSYKGGMEKACWRELSHLFVFMAKSNPAKVFGYCGNVAPLQNECYQHAVGVLLLSSEFDKSKASTICNPIKKDSIPWKQCITTTAQTLASSSKYRQQAQGLCNSFSGTEQKLCLAHLK